MASAKWTGKANNDDWNESSNWDTGKVPDETAYFGVSSQTQISFSSGVKVGQIEFTSDASVYHFDFGSKPIPALTITGSGIVNSSSNFECFSVKAIRSGLQGPTGQVRKQRDCGG